MPELRCEDEGIKMILVYLDLEKLPKDCDYCPLNYDDMYCTAVKLPKGGALRFDNVRPDWCPLGEVTLNISNAKCSDCIGGYCEECLEGKDNDKK